MMIILSRLSHRLGQFSHWEWPRTNRRDFAKVWQGPASASGSWHVQMSSFSTSDKTTSSWISHTSCKIVSVWNLNRYNIYIFVYIIHVYYIRVVLDIYCQFIITTSQVYYITTYGVFTSNAQDIYVHKYNHTQHINTYIYKWTYILLHCILKIYS